jgi:pimeloyl-ACP methyl ester carboxylesterase
VALKGADGVTLRGWYVPSRNGAAVLALHGTGSNRLGVARHARLLAGHGYGVLALDLRGHGESGGRSTSVPWRLDDDLDAALDWLEARPDVHGGRIGALGVSLGGEVALQLAARRTDLRAVVAEGVMGGTVVARVAPRPLLLISSGRSSEAAEGRAFARRGGASTALWNLPGARHGGALGTDPAGYEQRVVGFLDRALRAQATARFTRRSPR